MKQNNATPQKSSKKNKLRQVHQKNNELKPNKFVTDVELLAIESELRNNKKEPDAIWKDLKKLAEDQNVDGKNARQYYSELIEEMKLIKNVELKMKTSTLRYQIANLGNQATIMKIMGQENSQIIKQLENFLKPLEEYSVGETEALMVNDGNGNVQWRYLKPAQRENLMNRLAILNIFDSLKIHVKNEETVKKHTAISRLVNDHSYTVKKIEELFNQFEDARSLDGMYDIARILNESEALVDNYVRYVTIQKRKEALQQQEKISNILLTSFQIHNSH